MKLLRAFAYTVEPSRLTQPADVSGGLIPPDRSFALVLEQSAKPIDEDGVPIAFNGTDPVTRSHPVRDLCRALALEVPAKALAASRALAERLARATDSRSETALFVAAVYSLEGGVRRLHLWTFPREEALRFRAGKDPQIEVLTDIFSKRSHMRKGARFEGRDDRVGFLNGKAFDYQAHYSARQVADFWIVTFLGAQLEITASAGTKIVADCLRQAFERSDTAAEKDELYRATIALRASRRPRWSLKSFADEFLPSVDLRQRLLDLAPNAESRSALFDLDRAELESLIDTRIFRLEDGVMVSAPFSTVGKSVQLSGDQNRLLRYEGKVVKEQLRKSSRKRG